MPNRSLTFTPPSDAQLDVLSEPTVQDIEIAKVRYRQLAKASPKTRKYEGLLDAKAEDDNE